MGVHVGPYQCLERPAPPAPMLQKVARPQAWPDPPAPPRALTLRERAEIADLLGLGFTAGEIANIWRAAGIPLGPLEREIQRITGDPRPLPTTLPQPEPGKILR